MQEYLISENGTKRTANSRTRRSTPPEDSVTHTTEKIKIAEPRIISVAYFPGLKGVREDVLAALNNKIVTQTITKKQYVYLPYSQGENIFFLRNGNVEIGYLDESGRELSLEVLGAGDIFGSFIGMGASGGFARSLSKVTVAALPRNEFEQLLERSPRLASKYFAILNERITTLESRLKNLVFRDVKTRICCLLYSLFSKSGDPRSGIIKVPLTHQDIANLVASSRETASLHLSDLKKCGTITYERKQIRILRLQELQAIATCG